MMPKQGIWRAFHWGPLTALAIIACLFVCSSLASAVLNHPASFKGAFSLAVLLSWLAAILNHFFKALLLGPGQLQLEWKPSAGEEKFLQWCQACNGFKAPRSHHCRSCKRCILKMDHHCPWINNCVGHRNHRSFTLFLTFVVVGCSHAAVVIIQCLLSHLLWDQGFLVLRVDHSEVIHMNVHYLVFFFFGVGLSVGVTLSVGFLLYYQMKSILKNETGIESWILEKACRPGNEGFIYPYNLGQRLNFQQVISLSKDYVGDGIEWPLRRGCHKYSFTMEQLLQKKLKRKIMVVHSIVRNFSGSCVWYKWSFRSCLETPCCDETLLKVKCGDKINVSRWKRAWLYGEKMSEGNDQQQKGWIPSNCAIESPGAHVSGNKKTL